MTRRGSRRRWRDLPPEERHAIFTMLWLVPAAHMAVRVLGYQRLKGASDRRPIRAAATSAEEIDAYRLAVSRVQAYSWLPGNCLSRSLALYHCLRIRGCAPSLRLGVSLAGGAFAAHAWVELDGRVLNDRQDVSQRYRPLEAAAGTILSPKPK